MLNNHYNKTSKEEDSMLPVSKFKEEIIESVLRHRYTIISARPASGKSTLVPVYLAEHFSKVIVTNPRVIVAITLAMYIAKEKGITLGGAVGYRTGYNKCACRNTIIEYCTDAFQLIKTICDENTGKDMALIIDEVHEWTNPTEALVGWCKFMEERWSTKVVTMSATMETQKIAKYFGEDTCVFDIPGTVYDVEVIERPEDWLLYSIQEQIYAGRNVQVFLPSKREIYQLMEELKYKKAVVLPLHGDLSFEEQQRCFEEYALPLVVLSTNIGQTGLTIPRINSVVDTGKAIISIAKNGVEELCEVDISQADIEQRMWRSARTGNGIYILCSNTPIAEREKYPIPEIQRSLLDQIVLRFAANGIDMEKMEFFHQPDASAIITAKKLLRKLGALDDNFKVTEIGRKMSKMPVSATCARMIVEAEKYGCVEQVLIISAIVEMGSLLERQKGKDRSTAGRYSDFTEETGSDLIAELDVWNYLNELGTIDFKAMRISRRSFGRIKKYLIKLHEALYGIVEFSNSGDREAILKSCICAYPACIFVKGMDNYLDGDDVYWKLDNKSCLNYARDVRWVIGKPITLPGRFGPVNLLTFATRIDSDTLMRLVPNEITTDTKLQYVPSMDAVSINITKRFRGYYVYSNLSVNYQHPQLEALRAEYEEEKRRQYEETRSYFGFGPEQTSKTEVNRQESVRIDGRSFVVNYEHDQSYNTAPVISLQEEDIFTLKQDEVFLEDGSRVWVKSTYGSRSFNTITQLRNWLEITRLAELRVQVRGKLNRILIKTMSDALSRRDQLGKFVLTKDNGGYGEQDIFAYKCLTLRENAVRLGLVSEEEEANKRNSEALRYLLMKEISNNYRAGKFTKISGKKKKVLTETEQQKKADFDSFVEDVMQEVTLDNALDNIRLIEEYYQELMA